MIETKDSKRSLLIPKWLSYFDLNHGENLYPRKTNFDIGTKALNGIAEDHNEFQENPNLTKACNLLHSGIIVNDLSIAKEAAKYIIEYADAPSTTIKLAKTVLGKTSFDITNFIPEDTIAQVRRTLRKQIKNSLLWIELARLHTIKGRSDKAEKCVLIAQNLASENRFVVRSAARFYIHINQPDRAYFITNKAAKISNDPWIHSTCINSAILAEKKPKKLHYFDPSNISDDLLFHYSELIESLAILELQHRSEKRAKKLFRKAWTDPSESVVAHAEWIIRNIFPYIGKETKIDFSRSVEASSWHSYFGLDLLEALKYANEWGLEEPYSTHPFTCGSSIACSARNFALGVDIAKKGLSANPDDTLLVNNLIYSLLKNGDISKAEKILFKQKFDLKGLEKVYLTATTGLYYFKIKKTDLGRKYYKEAYDLCKSFREQKVAAKALLCLAEAEKEINSKVAVETINKALLESKDINEPDIILLRQFLES